MLVTNAITRRWSVEEFGRLSETGVFGPEERVELIEGEIVVMPPPGPEHSYSIGRGNNTLVSLYGSTHIVSVQCPLIQGDYSQPQPDFALISLEDHTRANYSRGAALVIEVSRSSLAYDRDEKATVYAKAGIQDYWIANIDETQLEVYRDPGPFAEKPGSFGYRSRQVFRPGDEVQPLLIPGAPCPVSVFFK